MDALPTPSLHSQLTKSSVVLNADFLESVSWKIQQYICLEMSIKSTEARNMYAGTKWVCLNRSYQFSRTHPSFWFCKGDRPELRVAVSGFAHEGIHHKMQ